jgi:hypothetical protein
MSDERLLPGPGTPRLSPRPELRVEYLDFQDVEDHREYRFRVYGPDGSSERRLRIPKTAFEARLVRVSDGPDLCYQKLVQAIAGGAAESPEVITTIVEVDLSRYRDEHAPPPKPRSSGKPRDPAAPVAERPNRPRYRPAPPKAVTVQAPAAPLVLSVEPLLEEGQRVKHAVFGMGVTTAATSARTVVSFDRDGSKSFVTSLLEVEVLSAPHTWEISPRGVNRPRQTAEETSDPSI